MCRQNSKDTKKKDFLNNRMHFLIPYKTTHELVFQDPRNQNVNVLYCVNWDKWSLISRGFSVELKVMQRTLEINYFQECDLIPCFVAVLDMLITLWAVKHNYCGRTAIMHWMKRAHYVCHWDLCVYTLDLCVLFLFKSQDSHSTIY